jgi:hypothetical protein
VLECKTIKRKAQIVLWVNKGIGLEIINENGLEMASKF